jgi:hypothetical protein
MMMNHEENQKDALARNGVLGATSCSIATEGKVVVVDVDAIRTLLLYLA